MFENKLWWVKLFNTLAGIVTFLFIVGLLKARPTYFLYANSAMKCFLAVCLIWRFGISKKSKITDFDRHACFVAGSYILVATFAEYFHFIRGFIETIKI